MNIVVVYDSYFGNTEALAKAIAGKVLRVQEIKTEDLISCDLMIVASPTRAFQCTKAIRQFLKKVDKQQAWKFLLFDTRMDVEVIPNKLFHFLAKHFGYANDSMAKILKKKGFPILGMNAFMVLESEGPLKEGEMDRLKTWVNGMVEAAL